ELMSRANSNIQVDTNTRLAWIVRTPVVIKVQDGTTTLQRWDDVWVDAIDGRIIGGEHYGIRSGSTVPTESQKLVNLLRAANRITCSQLVRPRTEVELSPKRGGALKYYGALAGVLPLERDAITAKFATSHE